MNSTWFKIKVWTKLILIGLTVIFILLFTYKNYSLTVDVWLLKVHTMSVLELLVATFLLGVVTTLLARPIYRTVGQIAQLRQKPEVPEFKDPPMPSQMQSPKPFADVQPESQPEPTPAPPTSNS